MLPDYDARGVADVLGLDFLRLPKDGTRLTSVSTTGDHRSQEPGRDAGMDVIAVVDDTVVIITEAKATAERHSSPSSFDVEGRLSSPSSLLIERAVENGLPRASLRHVAEWIAGGDRAKVSALEWGIVPKTTLERREVRLSVPESERTERIARLFVHARRALGTEAEARDFMTTPHPELDGRTPMTIAKTDLGTRRTERLLTALEYGLAL